jgi:protein O-GlcNAc transferase
MSKPPTLPNRKARRAAKDARRTPAAPSREAQAAFDLALLHLRAGRGGEAAAALGQVLEIDPGHAQALQQLGVLAFRAGQAQVAQAFFARAVRADPAFAEAHYNLGLALQMGADLDASAAALERAIALQPGFAPARLALGNVLHAQGRLAEAAALLEQAMTLDPADAAAPMNLGNVLREQGRLTDAARFGRLAAARDPGSVLAQRNLAITLRDQGRLAETLAAFDRAVALQPGFAEAESGRLFCLNYDPALTAPAVGEAHRRWGERWPPPAAAPFPNPRDPERRLRIGYVSGDLHAHPVGYFLKRVLEAHDRSAVETVCYSNGVRSDATSQTLRAAAGHWREIAALPDAAAEALVRADGVDILVDLSGHCASNRLPLFARRPAPLQASWLGYVATTGLPAMDYVLSDPVTAPPGADGLFTEAVLRLPHGRFCYAPPDDAPPVAAAPSSRGAPFTFGSFNDLLKVGPEVVGLWSRVLLATPGSRLMLKWASLSDEGVRARLAEAFAAEGLAPARLVFSAYSPHRDMLAQYGDVDVALDPFPFSGGLTTCEALWMGVPVVTLPQERPASRQSLAFLTALGLDDLAAASPDGYMAVVSALASDPARLAALRRSLRPRMASSPICDGARFTPTLEAAYRGMWRRWCAGEAAASFDVPGR